MKFETIKSNATEFAGNLWLKTKKASPEILLGFGIITMGAAVVSGIIAAKKHDEILKDHEERLEAAKAEYVIPEDVPEEEIADAEPVKRELSEINSAVRKCYVKTGFELVKLYGPTAALMGLSTACFVGMHNIQAGRIAGLSGAYTTLQEYIKHYEKNNIALNGEENHKMCKYGYKEVEVTEEDPETGAPFTEKKKVPNEASDILNKNEFHDQLFEFSRATSPLYQGRADRDLTTLNIAEQYIVDLVQARGWATVNDALVSIGMEPTKEGMVEGWVKGCGERPSFGHSYAVNNRVLAGYSGETILLDFNVHGNVYAILDKKEKEEVKVA